MDDLDTAARDFTAKRKKGAFDTIRDMAHAAGLVTVVGHQTETEGHRAGQTKRFIEISYYEED